MIPDTWCAIPDAGYRNAGTCRTDKSPHNVFRAQPQNTKGQRHETQNAGSGLICGVSFRVFDLRGVLLENHIRVFVPFD